jgi:hypothetical protein
VNIRAITSMKSRRLAASTTPHSDQQAQENARRAAVMAFIAVAGLAIQGAA